LKSIIRGDVYFILKMVDSTQVFEKVMSEDKNATIEFVHHLPFPIRSKPRASTTQLPRCFRAERPEIVGRLHQS